jgi:tetratricopeptide (TPR) repeat protein
MATLIRASLLFLGTLPLVSACGDDPTEPENNSGGMGLGAALESNQSAGELIDEAIGFLQLNNSQRARDLLLQALAVDESRADAHHLLGRTLMGMSKVSADHEGTGSVGLSMDKEMQSQGVQAMRRATELNPNQAEYFYWLGRGLHLSDSNAEALVALKQATVIDPVHGLSFKRLGIIHMDMGDPELALPNYLAAEKLLPGDPGPAFQVGNLLLEEDPEGARDAFRRSIAADISFPGPYNGLIAVLARLGDQVGSAQAQAEFKIWSEFEAELQNLLMRSQNQTSNLDAQLDVADAMLKKQEWNSAREFFQRTIMLDATNIYAHLNLGQLNKRLGNLPLALQHFEECIHLNQTAIEPRLQLLGICKSLGEEERLAELLALFERDAEKLDAPTRLRLASLLEAAGLLEEAGTHLRWLLKTYPENVEGKLALDALNAASAGQ